MSEIFRCTFQGDRIDRKLAIANDFSIALRGRRLRIGCLSKRDLVVDDPGSCAATTTTATPITDSTTGGGAFPAIGHRYTLGVRTGCDTACRRFL